MSEDTKEYFNFGTRFPYTTKSQENGWVEILETQDTIDATKVYEYGDNNPANIESNDIDSVYSIEFVTDSFKNEAKAVHISKIREKTGLSGEIKWKYESGGNGGVANKVGKSKANLYIATSGNTDTIGWATASNLQFYNNSNNVTKEVQKAIDELISFGGNNTPEIKLESENIREKKTERPRNNGEGKYLDLRVLYNTSVNKILGILSKNRKRKDLLFYKAMSWKSTPNSSNNEKYYSTAASNFKEDIDESVKLIPENFVFRSGIKYDLGLSSEVTSSGPFKAINNLAGGGAMLDAIIKAAKNQDKVGDFSFSERVDRFRNVPYVKDVDNNSIDSLTFKFQFGQFGLFSCEKEVVLPILKLASLFSYSFTGYEFEDKQQNGGDYRNNGNNWVKAPFEPKFNVMSKMYASLFNSGRVLINNILSEERTNRDESSERKPAIETLSQVPKLLSSVVNNAAGEARVTAFLFSIGSSIYGPFYASDVKWEFDYERTDNNGLPFSGTINFSGIKPLLVEDNIGLLSTGGQIIGDING